jgi:hypothetical protein
MTLTMSRVMATTRQHINLSTHFSSGTDFRQVKIAVLASKKAHRVANATIRSQSRV